jgi:hypothetical protein
VPQSLELLNWNYAQITKEFFLRVLWVKDLLARRKKFSDPAPSRDIGLGVSRVFKFYFNGMGLDSFCRYPGFGGGIGQYGHGRNFGPAGKKASTPGRQDKGCGGGRGFDFFFGSFGNWFFGVLQPPYFIARF